MRNTLRLYPAPVIAANSSGVACSVPEIDIVPQLLLFTAEVRGRRLVGCSLDIVKRLNARTAIGFVWGLRVCGRVRGSARGCVCVALLSDGGRVEAGHDSAGCVATGMTELAWRHP